jgi:hypothetical protein
MLDMITLNILLPAGPDLADEIVILGVGTAALSVLLTGAADTCVGVIPFDE